MLLFTYFFVTSLIVYVCAAPAKYPRPAPISHKQISPGVFSCSSGTATLKSICIKALEVVNSKLTEAGISVTEEGVLFTYEDPDDDKLNTGCSCTTTAEIKHKHVTVKIDKSADIELTLGNLTEPVVVALQLPVSSHAKIDVKQSFGSKLFGKCRNYASDSYSFLGDVSTNASVVIGLSLRTSLGQIPNGDYLLEIKPVVAVLFSLESTDLRFRVSGVSPFSGVWTFITGFTSTFFGSLKALIGGESVSRYLEALKFDIGATLTLSVATLPEPLRDHLFRLLDRLGSEALNNLGNKEVDKYTNNLEELLTARVGEVLGAREDGKVVYIVTKQTVDYLESGVNVTEFFKGPPADPSVTCYKGAKALCIACKECAGCIARTQECDRLHQEYNDKYGATEILRPKSLTGSPSP